MATIEQLSSALIKADAAGNSADAKVFADAIRKMRTQPAAQSSSPSQYGDEVPQLNATGAPVTQDAMPGARTANVPDWAKEYPTAYNVASTVRDFAGPTIEGLATAGGAALGAPLGPVGMAAGAGLGYGASQEVLRGADVLLGREAPRTTQELITQPVQNVAFGAVTEAAAPKIVGAVGKGVGRVVDFVKGNRSELKAANILRQSLTSGTRNSLDPIKNALAQAPEGITAAQATTNLKAPLWQSLNESVARQRGAVDDYTNILANQQANDIDALARLAGGESATETRAAVQGAQSALNKTTTPMREAALTQADDTTTEMVRLQDEAAAAREGAATSVDKVRRMEALKDKALIESVKGQPLNMRVSGSKSYFGDEAQKIAEKQAADAANGSLKFGEAARLREAALESLQNAGLAPLEGKPLADQVRAFIKDPLFAGNRERNMALNRVAREIEQWTGAQGVIDAHALDAIRKNSVNSIFANSPLTPKAKAKAVAQTMNAVRPALIDAIETAGGVGYRDYLQTYQAGMRNVNQKKLMGAALDLYKNNTEAFLKLVDGDTPKSVEKIMGYGNFNILDELGEEAMGVLQSAAQTLKNAKEMTSQSSRAQDALRELLAENVSLMRLPSLISAKFAATNAAIGILEKKIGKKVMQSLVEGLKSGKSASKLLDTLPASEKNRVLSILSDPNNYGIPTGGLAVGSGAAESIQNFATDPVGSLLNRNQRNQLAPANQNQLAR